MEQLISVLHTYVYTQFPCGRQVTLCIACTSTFSDFLQARLHRQKNEPKQMHGVAPSRSTRQEAPLARREKAVVEPSPFVIAAAAAVARPASALAKPARPSASNQSRTGNLLTPSQRPPAAHSGFWRAMDDTDKITSPSKATADAPRTVPVRPRSAYTQGHIQNEEQNRIHFKLSHLEEEAAPKKMELPGRTQLIDDARSVHACSAYPAYKEYKCSCGGRGTSTSPGATLGTSAARIKYVWCTVFFLEQNCARARGKRRGFSSGAAARNLL